MAEEKKRGQSTDILKDYALIGNEELNKEFLETCKDGFESKALVLLRIGANPNAKDYKGRTALILAVCSRSLKTVKLLLSSGADVNARDALGGTPLHWAVMNNLHPAVELLLKSGADASIRDTHFGVTPMDLAEEAVDDYKRIIEILTKNGQNKKAREGLP